MVSLHKFFNKKVYNEVACLFFFNNKTVVVNPISSF